MSKKNKVNRSVEFRNGSFSSILAIVAIAIFVVANLVVYQLPTSKTTFSTSEVSYYNFSDTTKNFLKNTLDQEITLYVLSDSTGNFDDYVSNICNIYKETSDKISVEKIDVAVNPNFVKKYNISATDSYANGVIVEAKATGEFKFINYDSLYYSESSYDENYNTIYTYYYDGEGQITSAIYILATDSTVNVYEVTGHGENSLSTYTLITDAFEKNNFNLAGTLTLANETAVPDDCDVLIIDYNNPYTTDFTAAEVELVKSYVDNGGNVVVVFNNVALADYTNLNSLLNYIGVKVEDGFIFENSTDYVYAQLSSYYSNYIIMPDVYKYSEITSDLVNSYVLAFYASQVKEVESTVYDFNYANLLSTSSDYTLYVYTPNESGQNDATTIEYTESAAIAKYIELTAKADIATADDGAYVETEPTAKALVIGCSYFFENLSGDDSLTSNNVKILTNGISQMTGGTSSIYVEPKTEEEKFNVATENDVNKFTVIFIVLLPAFVLLLGFTVWFIRRSK